MDIYTLPPEVRALVTPEVAAHIEKYEPTMLTAAEWSPVRGSVCELATRTQPVSGPDAQQTLSVICRYLKWTKVHLGSRDVATVFTEANVARFLVHLQGELAVRSRNAYRGRLRGCLTALGGEPPRTRRSDRAICTRPYTADELHRLWKAAYKHRNLREVMHAGLTTGKPLTGSDGETVAYRNHPKWESARYGAKTVGVVLNYYRLRATWVLDRLASGVSVVHLAHVAGITRRQFDDAMHFLPEPTATELKSSLR